MAVTIDWANSYVKIDKSDTTQVQSSPHEIREMDVDWLRLQIKAIEASEDGMWSPDIHRHVTKATLAGVTYGRKMLLINNFQWYVVQPGGDTDWWQLRLKGINSNLNEKLLWNGNAYMQLLGGNSAGMVEVSEATTGSASAASALAQATIAANNTQPA